jgi:hypothetical protein
MRDLAAVIVMTVAVAAVIIGLAFVGHYVVDRGACGQVEVVTNRDTRWGVWSGCYVQVDDGGRYVPLDTWRTPEEAGP